MFHGDVMDERQRQVFEKAYAALDAAGAMQAEQKPVLTYEQQAEIDDFQFSELQRRRRALYPEPEMKQPKADLQAQRTAMMIDAAERRMRASMMVVVEALAKEAGATCGRLEKEIRKLQQEIGQLRDKDRLASCHYGVVRRE